MLAYVIVQNDNVTNFDSSIIMFRMLLQCLYSCTLTGLKENDTDDEGCKELTKSDYIHLVWTTGAEFPGQPHPYCNQWKSVSYSGTLWIIVLLLLIGRKKSMAITTLAAAACYGLLFICLNKYVILLQKLPSVSAPGLVLLCCHAICFYIIINPIGNFNKQNST